MDRTLKTATAKTTSDAFAAIHSAAKGLNRETGVSSNIPTKCWNVRTDSRIREKNETLIWGNISELHAERINVPLNFRQVFDGAAPYEVTVAFGKRLEPWIVAASGSVAVK